MPSFGLMRWLRFSGTSIALFCGGLLLSGCLAPRTALPALPTEAIEQERFEQRLAFLKADEARRERLNQVAFPLLQASVELFPGNARPAIGIVTMTVDDLDSAYRESAIELYGLSRLPQIRGIAPGSPAEQAGLEVGDLITHVNGQSLEAAPSPTIEVLRKALTENKPLKIRILRDGTLHEFTTMPVDLAHYRQRLVYSQGINARATGKTIEINLGMLDFCENDTELAFVFAHELAHNALRHHRDFVFNYLMGTAVDIALLTLPLPTVNTVGLIALKRPSSNYEREADYVALYLIARAGYDLNKIRRFWPRMALLAPERRGSRHTLWSHPEPAERQILLLHAIEEIQQRLEKGLPLKPPQRG